MNAEELASFVPHRGKMFLLSRILRYDLNERFLEAEYDITPDCLFFREELGGVPSWLGFELIAQSIGALSGIARREQGLPPRMGFILSVSGMALCVPSLAGGSAAHIRVDEEAMIDAVYTFRGRVAVNGEEALSARLTVMEANSIAELRSA